MKHNTILKELNGELHIKKLEHRILIKIENSCEIFSLKKNENHKHNVSGILCKHLANY